MKSIRALIIGGVIAVSAVAVVAGATIPTDASHAAGDSRYGATCEHWVERHVPTPNEWDEGVRAHANCTVIPAGVQVRVKLNTPGATDKVTDWFSQTGTQMTTAWGNGPREMESISELEFRADPSGAGSECYVQLEKKDVKLGRDQFRVGIRCIRVAPHVKVRGVGDFAAQADVHTPYLVSDVEEGWYWSPWQTPSTLTDPTSRLQFELE